MLISILLIFIIIAVLIQIPVVQTKVVNYATTFISRKTHTVVNLKSVHISFPKLIVIEGLYLGDTKKDTLLYAGSANVNIAFRDLFRKNIHINSFELEDVYLHLNRVEEDSLFNYNFLLTAFSDTTKKEKTKPVKKSSWIFDMDNVDLKNIHLHYYDDYGGTNLAVDLKHLNLKMDQIDLERSIYDIDELLIDNLTASILVKKIAETKEKEPESILPKITAKKIQIINTNFVYGDSVYKQTLFTQISSLKLNIASVDLQKHLVSSDNIELTKSKITYNTNVKTKTDSIVGEKNMTPENNDWNVSVKNIDLDDNSIAYNVVNKTKQENVFDPSHLDFKHLILMAEDFYYSSDKTKVSIKKFSTIDQNNFSITQFETDFVMDQHSITANNLKVKTSNSAINADLNIEYASLKSLKDSIQNMTVNANFLKVSVENSDINYFNSQLAEQFFFKNKKNITVISGIIKGRVNNLNGKNLIIRTGANTILKSDFIITGLPTIENTFFNFPNLTLNSGKADIEMLAGSLIPETIGLPEVLSLQVIFKGQLKEFETTTDLMSSFGSAHLYASLDKEEYFKTNVSIASFDLGSLLKNKKMFGSVSLTASASGQGLDKNSIVAKVNSDVSEFYLNNYTYHNLKMKGNVTGQKFEGEINLNDENAMFDFNGIVSLNPDQELYKFHLNLLGADLQKLNFTKDDIRIGMMVESDLNGGSVNEINGKMGITNIIVTHEGKKYALDSLLLASINETNRSELTLSSSLIGIKYNGISSPFDLPESLNKFINNYFTFSAVQDQKQRKLQNFNFEIKLHNHPILSEVFFPQLTEFEPGLIEGSFDSELNKLKITTDVRKIVYGTNKISDLSVNVDSDVNALHYKISSSNISNSQIYMENILFDGRLADNKIVANLSSIDEQQNKKLLIRSQFIKKGSNYSLTLDPEDFYLMNDRWNIPSDNYIEFGEQGLLIHKLFFKKSDSEINVASVNNQFKDDINIEIKNFKLEDVSGIVEKDTSLVKGSIDGNVLLKRVNNGYGLIADARINNLFFREVPIGNLSVNAENPTTEKFNVDINLSGAENNLSAQGYFIPNGGNNSINIKSTIQSLSLKTVEALSMGKIIAASGNLTGGFVMEGSPDSPVITGELTFNNAIVKPAFLNNPLQLKLETLQLKKDGIYFNSFTVLDADQHSAVIDGTIKMKNFKEFVFDLNVDTKDFLLVNTTVKDNKEFYGRMIIDSKIDIKGPLTLPVVNARLKIKKGSTFTFAVPETKLTTDKGEDIVEFEDSLKLNPILQPDEKKEKQKSALTGFDISSIIEIDKQATLRLLMDPSSADSLVVKGEAALNFTIDRSGKMSLTGTYNLYDGNYTVSLESVIKRKFIIDPGSIIIWNGDPMDAEISINAIYSVRASPIDLIADQMSGLSEADKNQYKQRYPFLVYLKLRGEISRPEISFEIQLPPEDKGILGGAVNAKLNLLNEDPSALNKQVFALLVLGRFTQENPLQTETNSATAAVRTTVGRFLSAQLNQLSSKVVPGVELNFDIQSYDDYQTGTAEGRTQVDIGVKKQLFNERLSVQVGGVVDVEGSNAKQNTANDITSDVTLEYKITKDGRYRLKGFRQNQYEGAIEGQLVETGAGVLFVRDFNKWKELFNPPKKQIESSEKIK